MTAPYLDQMAARAAECGILADCAEDPRIQRWFRDHAAEMDGWAEQISRDAVQAHRDRRALDEIVANSREEADAAERQARASQNPGRGPSPAANCPSTAAGASDPGRGTSPLRTIADVFAAADGRRGVVVALRPRVVLSRDGETAL